MRKILQGVAVLLRLCLLYPSFAAGTSAAGVVPAADGDGVMAGLSEQEQASAAGAAPVLMVDHKDEVVILDADVTEPAVYAPPRLSPMAQKHSAAKHEAVRREVCGSLSLRPYIGKLCSCVLSQGKYVPVCV